MGTRLSDSEQYAHLWGTPELAEVFEERARLQRWLDIITALAVSQARLGIIPDDAAAQIAVHAQASELDLDYLAGETRRTSHSMLGLINALQQILPEEATKHVYVGATVQDVTDTWFALVMRDDLADDRQRPREHRDAGFATRRCEGERILFPRGVLVAELSLDFGTREALPAAMADLGQAIARDRREAERLADDLRRLDRPRQRTAVDGRHRVVTQALAELGRLPTALLGQVHADRPGEAVLRRQLRRAVAHQEQPGVGHGLDLNA